MDRLAEIFEDRRKALGWSYSDTWRAVYDLLGPVAPKSPDAISAYHKGTVTKRPDIEIIGALYEVYDLDVADTAPELLPRFRRLGALATASQHRFPLRPQCKSPLQLRHHAAEAA